MVTLSRDGKTLVRTGLQRKKGSLILIIMSFQCLLPVCVLGLSDT